MPRSFAFDETYYQRYYRDPRTRVASEASIRILADFVCSYLQHIGQEVGDVLDIGCGLGFWHEGIRRHFPRARYQGVEYSEYLCEQHGWTRGSVVDFRRRRKADLVVCQGVLQYVADDDCATAIGNLARLTRGALYLEALTTEDWEENCDQRVTDGNVHLRPGDWYRERLAPHFTNCGGGVFLARSSDAALFELERL